MSRASPTSDRKIWLVVFNFKQSVRTTLADGGAVTLLACFTCCSTSLVVDSPTEPECK